MDENINSMINELLKIKQEIKLIRQENSFYKKSFVPPHIHPDSKSESYHIIEGRMNIYIFRPNGKLFKVIQMGEKNSNKYFFYRMCKGFYHMPLSKSEWCVYHETYSGPFKKSKDVKFPKWAPNEEDHKGVLNFLRGHNIKFTK